MDRICVPRTGELVVRLQAELFVWLQAPALTSVRSASAPFGATAVRPCEPCGLGSSRDSGLSTPPAGGLGGAA